MNSFFESLFTGLDGAVFALLAFPLAAALAVVLAGKSGVVSPRRAAAYAAALHLIGTVGFAFIAGTAFSADNHVGTKYAPIGSPPPIPLLAFGPPPQTPNMPPSDVQFYIGLDGLSLPLVALTSLLVFLAVMVSWESVTDKPGGYYAWIFVLQTGVTGAFLAQDIVLFYAFFELTLIPVLFLIGRWGVGGGRRDAARKFFLYTLFGSLFTLVGLIGVVLANPTPLHPYLAKPTPYYGDLVPSPADPAVVRPPLAGPVTFSIPRLYSNHITWSAAAKSWATYHADRAARPNASPAEREAAKREADKAAAELARYRNVQTWLFALLIAGFVVKIPLVPFHTWLPAAYAEAPLGVTMLLSGVLAKLGTFGIIRLVLPLCPEASIQYGLPVVGVLAAISIVYAAFCAFAQRDLKMLAAYSSVSHLGLLTLGLFAYTTESLAGATLHMVNHGLTAGAMFALLAFLADRYRTLDMNQFGGLIGRHPAFAFFFIVLALAGIGLPGLNNFVSEMLMIAGLFDPRNVRLAGYPLAAAAAGGVFLSAWYTFTMVKKVFFGPVLVPAAAGGEPARGPTGRECITFGTLAACCLALGVCPQPALDTINPDAERIADAGDAARTRLANMIPDPADPTKQVLDVKSFYRPPADRPPVAITVIQAKGGGGGGGNNNPRNDAPPDGGHNLAPTPTKK